MTGTAVLIAVGGYTSVLLLLAAGVYHSFHVNDFGDILRKQRSLPAGVEIWVAPLVPVLEVSLSSTALLSMTVDVTPDWLARWSLLLVAALYLAFTAYAAFLLHNRPGAQCGCSGNGAPTNSWVVARAAIMSVAAATGSSVSWLPSRYPSAIFASLLLASTAFALLLWIFPAAMSQFEEAGLEAQT